MKSDSTKRLGDLRERAQALASTLGDCWPLYDGSVTVQRLRCGKPGCACHRDDAKRHGPYATWTTKVRGKTVAKRLSIEEAEIVKEWIENRRQLQRTTKELVRVSREMLPLVLAEQAQESP